MGYFSFEKKISHIIYQKGEKKKTGKKKRKNSGKRRKKKSGSFFSDTQELMGMRVIVAIWGQVRPHRGRHV